MPSAQSIAALQAALATGSATPGVAGTGTAAGGTPQGAGATAARGTAGTESQLTGEERSGLQGLIDLVRSKNPYQLSREGALTLPGFAPIALMGLTEDQATLRLKVEPAFRDIDIRLTRLPIKKTGAEALKPFGYDLFDRAPSTFAPVTNVPVPSDYTVGAGDELDVQLYGNQNRTLRLIVGRDGRIRFPELGPNRGRGPLFHPIKLNHRCAPHPSASLSGGTQGA